MNANQIFELFARRGWPLLRPFVRVSKRCRKCILSEKCSPLKDGLCEGCRRGAGGAEAPPPPTNQPAFDQVIRSHINGNKYHSLLLLSGGKDSAYILDRLKREYPGLRILCVVVDNGFMSPFALRSAEYAADKHHCDLLVVHSHVERFAKTLRQAFLDLGGLGAYGVVDKADGDLIFEIGRNIAAEWNIPLMLAGLSWVQLEKIFGIDDFKMECRPGVLDLFPLAVWRTDEQEIRATVRNAELLPPGSDSPIVSNNELILSMSVVDVLNNGYSSFEPEFAQLVREGKTDRKTWLHAFELLEFATRKGFLDRQAAQGLARLGLTIRDVVKGAA